VHEQLVEGIVVGDDDLMARYLEGAPIGRDELEGTLSKGVAAGVVFPVLCASATTGVASTAWPGSSSSCAPALPSADRRS